MNSTSHPPITLQDLQVLDKEARISGGDYEQVFLEALGDYYRSGALQRLAELAEDGERYRWLKDMWPLQITRLVHSHHTHGPTSTELSAAIDSARAPSVKEGKS